MKQNFWTINQKLYISEPVLPDILYNIKLQAASNELNEEPGLNSTTGLNDTSQVEVTALEVGILNGAKPLTQVILNPIIGVIVDKYV